MQIPITQHARSRAAPDSGGQLGHHAAVSWRTTCELVVIVAAVTQTLVDTRARRRSVVSPDTRKRSRAQAGRVALHARWGDVRQTAAIGRRTRRSSPQSLRRQLVGGIQASRLLALPVRMAFLATWIQRGCARRAS